MKNFHLKVLIFLLVCMSSPKLSAQEFNKVDADGKKHGVWRGYFEDSKRLRFEGTFEHGVETGTFNYFDDTKSNGVIATRVFSKKGTEAYTILYDRAKNIVSEGKTVNKLNEGEWKVYHEASKQPMTIENYVNGKLHGSRKVYFKDGVLAEESNYQNGLLHGTYKKYTEKGSVLEETVYVNGKYHGPAIFRDSEGQLASKGRFVEGLKKGEWEFYVKGKLVKKETFPRTVAAGKKGKPKN